jgi:hypothetical protein
LEVSRIKDSNLVTTLAVFAGSGELGRKLTETVDTDPLVWRKIHHLAFQCEVVAFFRAAHYPFALGTYDLYAEVVELEGGVC